MDVFTIKLKLPSEARLAVVTSPIRLRRRPKLLQQR